MLGQLAPVVAGLAALGNLASGLARLTFQVGAPSRCPWREQLTAPSCDKEQRALDLSERVCTAQREDGVVTTDDDGFKDHVWAIEQRLPDARENLDKEIDRPRSLSARAALERDRAILGDIADLPEPVFFITRTTDTRDALASLPNESGRHHHPARLAQPRGLSGLEAKTRSSGLQVNRWSVTRSSGAQVKRSSLISAAGLGEAAGWLVVLTSPSLPMAL